MHYRYNAYGVSEKVNSTCTIQIWDRQTDKGEQMEEYEIYIKVVCGELKKSLNHFGFHIWGKTLKEKIAHVPYKQILPQFFSASESI